MTLLIIYLVGCVVAYVINRETMKKLFNEYTVSDRRHGIFISVLSWISVAGVIMNYISNGDEDNTPAKW